LAGVRLIESREPATRELLDSWRLAMPVHDVADAAFLMPPATPAVVPAGITSIARPAVGMTVRQWFRSAAEQTAFEAAVATFVRRLVDDYQASVVFVPQVTFSARGDDDRVVARRVAMAADRGDRVRVVESPLSPSEVKWVCGRMNAFVGTRMHSNIFAVAQGVPTLAIAYQPKTVGIMNTLQPQDFVVPIADLQADDLTEGFRRLWHERGEIRARLKGILDDVVESAYLGGRLIAEDYENLAGISGDPHEPSVGGA